MSGPGAWETFLAGVAGMLTCSYRVSSKMHASVKRDPGACKPMIRGRWLRPGDPIAT